MYMEAPAFTPLPSTFGEMRTAREKLIDAECRARVKQGIALLEREHGPNWRNRIDLDTLDLAAGSTCILGQLYGSYREGVTHFIGDDPCREKSRAQWGVEHGFFSRSTWGYQQLQEAWEQVLALR